MILEPQQGPELVLVEFFYADANVVRQHEVEKVLLLAVEVRDDVDLGPRCAFFAGDRRKCVGRRAACGEALRRASALRQAHPATKGFRRCGRGRFQWVSRLMVAASCAGDGASSPC